MVRYSTFDEWFSGYAEPTIENIYKILTKMEYSGKHCGLQNHGKKTYKVYDWIHYSKE